MQQTVTDGAKFLIIGTGRSGSSLLAAILASSGGNFGLPSLDDWNRRGGALEHPYVLNGYKWYSRTLRMKESLIPDQVARLCLKQCRKYLQKNFEIADYVKSSRLVWLVDEANKLTNSIGVIGIYRKFSGYLVSQYRKSGGSYQQLKDMWTDVNATVLLQAHTYPFAFVSYEELVDLTKTNWAVRVSQLTGLSAEEILSNRKALIKPAESPRIDTFEDETTRSLYDALCNFHRNTS